MLVIVSIGANTDEIHTTGPNAFSKRRSLNSFHLHLGYEVVLIHIVLDIYLNEDQGSSIY